MKQLKLTLMTSSKQKLLQQQNRARKINVLFPVILFFIFIFLFAKTVKSQLQIINTMVNRLGTTSYGGDGGLASNAYINITGSGNTGAVATDRNGDIIFCDYGNNRIRKINHTTNIITTIAGTGAATFGGDGGLAINAQIYHPIGIVVDAANNIYFTDASNFRIRRIDAVTGIITTVAGTGAFSSGGNDGDNGLAINCQFRWATHLTMDGFSNLYVVDNYRVRKINLATGIIQNFAGQTTTGYDPLGGEGMLATSIHFGGVIYGLLSDNIGNVYVTAYHRIIKISGGICSTIIGHWWDNGQLYNGDGGLAVNADFSSLAGMCFNGAGELLVCDMQNHLIRKYNSATGIITTVAGDTHGGYPFLWAGFAGDGGSPIYARFNYPTHITYNNTTGDVVIVDANNNRIRKIYYPCTPISLSSNVTVCSSSLPYRWAGMNLTASGIYSIHQTMANGCDSSATLRLTVLGTMPAITGPNKVCVGSSIQLSNSFTGGVWESVTGRATVNATGLVTGTSAGVATIKYSYNNELGCYSATTFTVTVSALPTIPGIAYAPGTASPQCGANMRLGRTFGLIGTPVGGVWSSSNPAVININPTTGVTSTVSLGTATVSYTVTNSNNCSNSRSITRSVVVCSSKGIIQNNENKIGDFIVYPNPAKSMINIKSNTTCTDGKIIVTDLFGKTILQKPVNTYNNTIDVTSFAKGVYFITIITNNSKQTEKITVE